MLWNLGLLIWGFVLLIKGADFFVDGSSSVARLLKVPSIIIGLTIVAMGTSAPEASVSISAALSGNNEIAVSNIVGSNLFNLLIVIGICVLMKPIIVSKDIYKRDLPLCIAFTLLGTILILDNNFSKLDGILMLICFMGFMALLTRSALNSRKTTGDVSNNKNISPFKSLLLIIVGICGIILGGNAVVNSSSYIASYLGMSQTLIGLTIVAIGTSLPELVTSLVASKKGENDLALGNVIGSNIFNLLFILGLSSTISPIKMTNQAETIIDFSVLSIITIVFYLFVWTKKTINRMEGCIIILIYCSYMVYAILR